MGYKPALTGQKTSLKQACINGDFLASEFDNIFYNASQITAKSAAVVHFYKFFLDFSEARKISDHVPIYFQFSLN